MILILARVWEPSTLELDQSEDTVSQCFSMPLGVEPGILWFKLKVPWATYSLYLMPFGWDRSQTGTQWVIICIKGNLCCPRVTKLCVLFLIALGSYSGHGQIVTKVWLLVCLKNGTSFLFYINFFNYKWSWASHFIGHLHFFLSLFPLYLLCHIFYWLAVSLLTYKQF